MRPPESVSSLVHKDCVDPVFKDSFLLFELLLPRNLNKGEFSMNELSGNKSVVLEDSL